MARFDSDFGRPMPRMQTRSPPQHRSSPSSSPPSPPPTTTGAAQPNRAPDGFQRPTATRLRRSDAGRRYRVLVDRVWPRGRTKEQLRLDAWAQDLGPSTQLRKWFGHDPARWAEFQARYRAELADSDLSLIH